MQELSLSVRNKLSPGDFHETQSIFTAHSCFTTKSSLTYYTPKRKGRFDKYHTPL